MNIKFYDELHKNFYIEKTKGKELDCYNKSLIYLLSLTEDTRNNFRRIYNIEKQEIKIEVLNEAWQTSTSLAIIRLAFNLFNGMYYNYNENSLEDKFYSTKYFTPYNIFCYKSYMTCFIQAIYMRFESEVDG